MTQISSLLAQRVVIGQYRVLSDSSNFRSSAHDTWALVEQSYRHAFESLVLRVAGSSLATGDNPLEMQTMVTLFGHRRNFVPESPFHTFSSPGLQVSPILLTSRINFLLVISPPFPLPLCAAIGVWSSGV